MRIFNTTGPVRPNQHYCLPSLERFNLNDVLFFIEQQKYFVLHALHDEKIFKRSEMHHGVTIIVWGM